MPKRAGRPSVSQTPAPKSDKIYGSKKNPKGSATEKKSKSINLSNKTIDTLKEKLDNFKKSHPSKKNIDLNDLKAVYRRGSGAYSSSHRPTITGGAPNSRAAWSYARVNKFLKKAGGAKVKAAYVQDDDLMADGGKVFNDKELLAKWKKGESIGFTGESHLKAKGLIPRADGSKRKSEKYMADGGVAKGGDCYAAAGQFCMGSVYMKEPVEFVGEPYLIHAEVRGQGKIEGLRFGHAWVEDDENVYDYSNARKIVMPKVVYYAIGDVKTENPLKYQKYTFPEARAKMLKTKHYGSWDIETEYKDGGLIDLIEGVKLDKNIYEQNIEHHSVYSKINSDIDAEKILKENFIQSFENNVQIENYDICAYRLLMLDDISDLDTNNLGIYWAYSENKVVIADDEGYEHKKSSYKNQYVIKVKANIKNINWQDTFDLYVMNDWMEGEIRFIKNTKPSETYYKKLGDSEWIKLDKNVTFADGGMIAPNGNPSNLTPEQYKLVRTPEFKAWFGDWENDPENASKVVDENGEPMVVYHGTKNEFSIFDLDKVGTKTDKGMWGKGFYFSSNKKYSETYASSIGYVFDFFLSIKNPYIIKSQIDIPEIITPSETMEDLINAEKIYSEKFRETLIDKGNDGVFVNFERIDNYIEFVAFEPNQIKLADGTNTTFDMNNPDIRFSDGGQPSQLVTCINCSWEWETADSAEFDKYVCHQCGFDNSLFYDGGLLKPTMTLEQIAEANLMKDYLKPVSIEYLEEQLNKGMQHEKEHTDSDEVAKSIALHHLAERPDYYEELEKMEKYGENDILENNSPEEYEIEAFLKKEKEEAHMVMTCDSSKIYKAMICKTKCEIADKRMAETENEEEIYAWLHYKNTWNDCLQDILDDNIEIYKSGGKTCGCGCGSIYSKGGLAFANGGLAYGNSHDKGGMPLTVKSTGQNIEIEGGEGVVNKRSMQSSKKVEFEGKQMTPCEAVSKINEMGGGVKFKCDDVKNIIAEDGQF
jgi:hypothetical protein